MAHGSPLRPSPLAGEGTPEVTAMTTRHSEFRPAERGTHAEWHGEDCRCDVRYEYTTCIACGRSWQFIDFGCALHHLVCDKVDADDVRAAVLAARRAALAQAGGE